MKISTATMEMIAVRGGAAQPERLQPVGDRIEEIGDGAADQERQHDVPEEPQRDQEHRRSDAPVFQLIADGQTPSMPFPD